MLKKSLFSPTRPRHAETRLFPCGVLASLIGSRCRGEPLGYRNHWREFSVRQDQFNGRTAHTKCGLYLLVSSLAAALPASLFEHPAGIIFLLYHACGPSTYWHTYHRCSQPDGRSDPAAAGSVSSSRDKLNGMKRLKRRVGYEEIKDGNGVPNGIQQTTERPLSFTIDLLVEAA
jgi:hypothetical protein